MADDPVFRALADPTRREILDALFEREGQSLGELERLFDMTRFGVMKHVKVLEEAKLVVTRKVGRSRLHYLNPVPIREIHDRWTGKFAARASGALLALRAGLEKGGTMAANGKPSHVYVVYIRATPERIWDALTQSEFTQQYLLREHGRVRLDAGSEYEYAINGETAIVGEVLEAVPPVAPGDDLRRSLGRRGRTGPSLSRHVGDRGGRRRSVEADGRPRRLRRRDEHVRPGDRRHAVHPQRAEDAARDRRSHSRCAAGAAA